MIAPVSLCLFGLPRLQRDGHVLHVGARKSLASGAGANYRVVSGTVRLAQ